MMLIAFFLVYNMSTDKEWEDMRKMPEHAQLMKDFKRSRLIVFLSPQPALCCNVICFVGRRTGSLHCRQAYEFTTLSAGIQVPYIVGRRTGSLHCRQAYRFTTLSAGIQVHYILELSVKYIRCGFYLLCCVLFFYDGWKAIAMYPL